MDLCDAYSLIDSYKFLEKTCKSIDGYVLNQALCFGPLPTEFSTQVIADKIIALTERKKTLVNLKVFIDECVNKMTVNSKKIMMLKLHYRCSMQKICAILNFCERTAFRHVKKAMDEFLFYANKHSYCDKAMNLFKSEKWLNSIRDRYIKKNENTALAFC